MSDVKISKATDRYSCNLCKSRMSDNLYEINIGSINICLCPDCFRKVRMKMNEVSIPGYKGKAESEVKELSMRENIIIKDAITGKSYKGLSCPLCGGKGSICIT